MSATPFDELAADYDLTFTHTALGAALRGIVWKRFDSTFKAGQRILELGCGTGEDAVRLAHMGLDVVATDPSEEMLRVARTKARLHGAQRLVFHRARMEDVPALVHGSCFAGVLSNFGAINCVSDIPRLTRGLAALCAPGAVLMFVVMGRYVPWEWAWYAIRGNRRKALRRLLRGGSEWRGLSITYPTPRELTRMLTPYFEVTDIAPLGCVLPPSYASGWLDRSPVTLRALSALEHAAHGCPALAGIADHYIVEARRNDSGAEDVHLD